MPDSTFICRTCSPHSSTSAEHAETPRSTCRIARSSSEHAETFMWTGGLTVEAVPGLLVRLALDRSSRPEEESMNILIDVRGLCDSPLIDARGLCNSPLIDVRGLCNSPLIDVRGLCDSPLIDVPGLCNSPLIDVRGLCELRLSVGSILIAKLSACTASAVLQTLILGSTLQAHPHPAGCRSVHRSSGISSSSR